MRKVLLIDDLRDFRFVPDDMDVTIARTSAEALAILTGDEEVQWNEIWFDHDLGTLADGRIDDTMKVVDYLAFRAVSDNPVSVDMVYIHTSNEPAKQQISASMRRYGYPSRLIDAKTVFIVDTTKPVL